jgi:hypothetical protein
MNTKECKLYCETCQKTTMHYKRVVVVNPVAQKLLNLKRFCFGEPMESVAESEINVCSQCGAKAGENHPDSIDSD